MGSARRFEKKHSLVHLWTKKIKYSLKYTSNIHIYALEVRNYKKFSFFSGDSMSLIKHVRGDCAHKVLGRVVICSDNIVYEALL